MYYHLRDVLVFMANGLKRGYTFEEMIHLVSYNINGPFDKAFYKASLELQNVLKNGIDSKEEKQKIYNNLVARVNLPLFTSLMIAIDIKKENNEKIHNVLMDVVNIIESNEEYRRHQKSRWKMIREKKKRKREELSQFIDVLALTASDYRPLEQTIQQICHKLDSQISREFQFALMEVNAGKKLEDALRDLSRKTEIEEIGILAKKIIQAKVLNNSVEKALIVEAERIRKTNM